MSIRASLKTAAIVLGVCVAGAFGAIPLAAPPVHAASPAKPAISEDASAAVAQMGKSLLADQFSFQARTLRVYWDSNGQPLHIAHAVKVTVRRPDRLLVDVSGDDGSTKMLYDGTKVILFSLDTKKYSVVEVPNTLQGMLETVIGKLGVDFPLSDFITNDPAKSFLFGVTSGKEVGTAVIDGVPCRHLLFTQSHGIELELWVEKNERSLPRRLIVTYRSLQDQPSFVAELFGWDFSVHPSDQEFVFTAPEGAAQVTMKLPTDAAHASHK